MSSSGSGFAMVTSTLEEREGAMTWLSSERARLTPTRVSEACSSSKSDPWRACPVVRSIESEISVSTIYQRAFSRPTSRRTRFLHFFTALMEHWLRKLTNRKLTSLPSDLSYFLWKLHLSISITVYTRSKFDLLVLLFPFSPIFMAPFQFHFLTVGSCQSLFPIFVKLFMETY